jgi:uncharacterized iron-regulated membrane protein
VNAGSWAAVILAVATLVTAVTGLVALFRKQTALGTQQTALSGQVSDVHTLVNNQLDRQLTYNQQLAAALTGAGVAVPQQEPSTKPSEPKSRPSGA